MVWNVYKLFKFTLFHSQTLNGWKFQKFQKLKRSKLLITFWAIVTTFQKLELTEEAALLEEDLTYSVVEVVVLLMLSPVSQNLAAAASFFNLAASAAASFLAVTAAAAASFLAIAAAVAASLDAFIDSCRQAGPLDVQDQARDPDVASSQITTAQATQSPLLQLFFMA